MDVLPSIDLRAGQVVRLIQGDYQRQIDYSDDPLAVALQFESAGARWLHVVDLDGARSGRIENLLVIRQIVRNTRLKVEVGGGVRSDEVAGELLSLGVHRVIVGTAALKDWEWFSRLVGKPAMAGRVMLGLDARQGKLAVHGWTSATELTAVEVARRAESLPIGGIICTDIATDGMMAGPNLDAMAELVAASGHPIIASGGVGSIGDVLNLAKLKVAGVIIGRSLYEGRFRLSDVLEAVAALH